MYEMKKLILDKRHFAHTNFSTKGGLSIETLQIHPFSLSVSISIECSDMVWKNENQDRAIT